MNNIDQIISLCKRRGFIYPTSEIYGGIGGFYDFGPLGVELSNNIKNSWWRAMVYERENVVGLDSAIILNPKVWEASGHVKSFTDPLVECKICHNRFRADQNDEIEEHVKLEKSRGSQKVEFTEPRQFNLLFKTYVGPVEDTKSQSYLRGETCQGIFINFQNILSSTRLKIPFGIAQIGKAFRNEVTPGKFLFRVREFEQMELEYFVKPEEADNVFEYWKNERMNWIINQGINKNKLRFRRHEKDERAHYAKDSWDIEYEFPDWGFKELEGIANRTDYDLLTHTKASGKNLIYKDPFTGESFVPYVIEPSIGVSRLVLAILADSYSQIEDRFILKLSPKLAPYKAAVFPLLANKNELVTYARNVFSQLKSNFRVGWDERGNIGKRYLSQDEIGTPWCITIDYQTLEDHTVTVRDRDTTKQDRISVDKLISELKQRLNKN